MRTSNHISKAKKDNVIRLLRFLNLTPDEKCYLNLILTGQTANIAQCERDIVIQCSRAGHSDISNNVEGDFNETLPL